jgi:uncharacterized delta-60 repeat protein
MAAKQFRTPRTILLSFRVPSYSNILNFHSLRIFYAYEYVNGLFFRFPAERSRVVIRLAENRRAKPNANTRTLPPDKSLVVPSLSPGLRPVCPRNTVANAVTTREGLRPALPLSARHQRLCAPGFPSMNPSLKSLPRRRLALTLAAVVAFVALGVSPARAQSGSLDITFNPGPGVNNGEVFCMVLETNGQIVIGGNFASFNGANRTDVARVNSDGSVDTTFDPGVGPNLQVNAVAVQSDGKVLIGGGFTSIDGISWNPPARLRVDGSVDTSFDTSSADGAGASGGGVNALALQADGKVLIGGSFSTVSGTSCGGIARLNTNGTLDVTFNTGDGLSNGVVNALGVQSTGHAIVGVNFFGIFVVSSFVFGIFVSDG